MTKHLTLSDLPPKMQKEALEQINSPRPLADLLENDVEVNDYIHQAVQRDIQRGRGKRLRQSSKPLLNKLETAFYAWMKREHPEQTLRPQAKRYELARGIWYKPDFTAMVDGTETAYEVKGPKAFRGGFENLKVAARVWPEVEWWLVWQDGGEWKHQQILP